MQLSFLHSGSKMVWELRELCAFCGRHLWFCSNCVHFVGGIYDFVAIQIACCGCLCGVNSAWICTNSKSDQEDRVHWTLTSKCIWPDNISWKMSMLSSMFFSSPRFYSLGNCTKSVLCISVVAPFGKYFACVCIKSKAVWFHYLPQSLIFFPCLWFIPLSLSRISILIQTAVANHCFFDIPLPPAFLWDNLIFRN